MSLLEGPLYLSKQVLRVMIGVQDKLIASLKETHKKQGALKLASFRRVSQLGTGDVGLVDLVELSGDGSR